MATNQSLPRRHRQMNAWRCFHCRLDQLSLVALILLIGAGRSAAQYVDTMAGCLTCHQNTLPKNDFCELVPAAIWNADDKHRQAFYLLHETDPADPQKGAAKRNLVTRILGFELREAFADDRYEQFKTAADGETARKVSLVQSCLRCHATFPLGVQGPSPETPPLSLSEGVSCQACHGPGGKWTAPHQLMLWRVVTPSAKAELGFTDVRSPINKAKLCASCHVGNMAEGKFVRHEWYAGGHPPLPSLEPATFAQQMPVHWKSLREKVSPTTGQPFEFRDALPAGRAADIQRWTQTILAAGVPREAIKSSYREANFPDAAAKGLDPCSDLPRTKDAIVAGGAVLESYVRLVGDYAAAAAEGKEPWPELALYDCTACHHELRSGLGLNSRPKRRHAPGRPPLATWPLVLGQLGAHQAAGYEPASATARWDAIQQLFGDLDKSVTRSPFGDPAAVRDAAKNAVSQLDQLSKVVLVTRFDAAAAKQSLRLLTDPKFVEAADFPSARQTAWAIREIVADAHSRQQADVLFKRGAEDVLALELPSGPNRSVMEYLVKWLGAAAQYDSAWFRTEQQAIGTKLGGP